MKPHYHTRRPKPRHPMGTRVETRYGPGTVTANKWTTEPGLWRCTAVLDKGEGEMTLWEGLFTPIYRHEPPFLSDED